MDPEGPKPESEEEDDEKDGEDEEEAPAPLRPELFCSGPSHATLEPGADQRRAQFCLNRVRRPLPADEEGGSPLVCC